MRSIEFGGWFSNPEKEQKKERENRGKNVQIRNFWQRHAQKMSAEILNTGKTGLSTSAISPAGAERATALGRTIEAGKDGAKGYRSSSARTQETFDAMMEGYMEANPETPVREEVRLREQLIAPGSGNKKYLDLYDQMWSKNKSELLAQRGLKPEDFATLSPSEQEDIAETAEEPVIQEWIDNPESELAKAFSPRIPAADFAVLFNRRHERMAERLNKGSEIDLFHNTHKTATEAFLASGVLIRKSDGQKITKITELGGSLKILDNWESISKTDAQGKPETTVVVSGQEFSADNGELDNLAKEGLQRIQGKRRDEELEKYYQDSLKRMELEDKMMSWPDLSDEDFVLLFEEICKVSPGQLRPNRLANFRFNSRPKTPAEEARTAELRTQFREVIEQRKQIIAEMSKLRKPKDEEEEKEIFLYSIRKNFPS